jgi:glycosyltransferase involved in cell wall biosynthesis
MPEAAIGLVIPAYNAGGFLSETIESVHAQTWTNWECAIVDDGSTDETSWLLKSLKDPRIHSIRQNNRGEQEARFRAFSLTRAPNVVFLDADDRLLPDTLARYIHFLDDHPTVGVAYGERRLINESGRSFGWRGSAILNRRPEGDVLESILRRPFLSTPSQACLRREAVPPAKWMGNGRRSGDWVLLAGAAYLSRFAYMGKVPLVEYRIHEKSQLRSLTNDFEVRVGIPEFDECLNCLFSIPGLEIRFDARKLSQLRQAAFASCLAIKGQEFLRCREYGTARKYFRAALKNGSRDFRDVLCWLGTFSPSLLHRAEAIYGVIDSKSENQFQKI